MDQTYLDQQQLDANVNHQQLSQDTNLIPQQQLQQQQQQQQPLQQLQQYQQQPLSNANFSGDNRFQQYQPRVTPSVSSSQQSIHTTTGYVTMHSGNYNPNQQYGVPNQYTVLQQQPPRQQSYEENINPLSYNTNDRTLSAPIPPLHIQHQLASKQNQDQNQSQNRYEQSSMTSIHTNDNSSSVNNSPNTMMIKQEHSTFQPQHSNEGSSAYHPVDQQNHQQQQQPQQQHQHQQPMTRSICTRCKKGFDQPIIYPKSSNSTNGNNSNGQNSSSVPPPEPRTFKLCDHCRKLQRQRSRRWQKKTKDREGVCRRCGSEIPLAERRFVLCPSCRENLRLRKASRAAQGRCVHCSGPLDASILSKENEGNNNGDEQNTKSNEDQNNELRRGSQEEKPARGASHKVCQRCRENDKIRRANLEKMGNCNRCAKALDPNEYGRNKVCFNCRTKKKRSPPENVTNTDEVRTSPIQNQYGMNMSHQYIQPPPPPPPPLMTGHHQFQPQPHMMGHEQMNTFTTMSNSGVAGIQQPNNGMVVGDQQQQQQQHNGSMQLQPTYYQSYVQMPPPLQLQQQQQQQQQHYSLDGIPQQPHSAPTSSFPPPPPPPLQLNQHQGLQQYSHAQQQQQQQHQQQQPYHQEYPNN